MNEKVRKDQGHFPEGLPCTVVQAVHCTRAPSQRGYTWAVILSATPSVLELAVSAQRGCLFLIHIKTPFWATGGPISCLLTSQPAPLVTCNAQVQGKLWGLPRDPGQDSAPPGGCPAWIPGLQAHWLLPRCLLPNQNLQDPTGLHSPSTYDGAGCHLWGEAGQ